MCISGALSFCRMSTTPKAELSLSNNPLRRRLGRGCQVTTSVFALDGPSCSCLRSFAATVPSHGFCARPGILIMMLPFCRGFSRHVRRYRRENPLHSAKCPVSRCQWLSFFSLSFAELHDREEDMSSHRNKTS